MSFFDGIDKTEFQKIEKNTSDFQESNIIEKNEDLEPDWDELIKDEEMQDIINEEYLLDNISDMDDTYNDNENIESQNISDENNENIDEDEIEIIVTESDDDNEVINDEVNDDSESIKKEQELNNTSSKTEKQKDLVSEDFEVESSKQDNVIKKVDFIDTNTKTPLKANIIDRTIISEKVTIDGDINVSQNITIAGVINGDIHIKEAAEVLICESGVINGNITGCGCINICGTVTGDISGDVIVLNRTQVFGKIEAQRNIHVSKDSVVIGNVLAKNIDIAGAINGDINIKGQAILEKTAIVKGNIQSKAVQINPGATIHGVFTQSYTDDNPITFFDNIKKK